MRIPGRRLLALALALALMAGDAAAVCAGWTAIPGARMACCAEDAACPMHSGGEHHGAGFHDAITQAQADACCAASENDSSDRSAATVVVTITHAVPGTGIALPPSIPSLVRSDGWRTTAPPPVFHVPKHVLLSVFLV